MTRIRSWYGNGATAGTVVVNSTATTSIGAGDSPFDLLAGTTTVVTTGTNQPRLSFPTSTAINRVGWSFPVTPTLGVSLLFNLDNGYPVSSGIALMQGLTTTQTVQSFRVEVNPTGNLVLRNAAQTTVSTSAAVLSPATGYRCDVTIDASGNATANAYAVSDNSLAASTAGTVGTTHDGLRFGAATTQATAVPSWSIDELRVFNTADVTEPVATGPDFYQSLLIPPGRFSPASFRAPQIGDYTIAATTNYPTTAADTAAATDSTTPTLTLARVTTDTAPSTETVATTGTFSRTVTDTAAATDTLTRAVAANRALAEAITTTDTTTRTSARTRAVADSAPATDAVTRTGTRARALADSAPATDAVVTGTPLLRTQADSAPATDAVVRAPYTRPRSTSDTASASDTTTRSTSRSRTATESAPATDTSQQATRRSRTTANSAPATDATSRTFAPTRASVEATNGSDTLTRSLTQARQVADTAATNDASDRDLNQARTNAENAAASDVTAATTVHPATTDDTAAADDSTTRLLAFARDLTDDAAAVDVCTPGTPVVVTDPRAALAVNRHRAMMDFDQRIAGLVSNQRKGRVMDSYIQGDLLPALTCVLYDGNKPFDATGANSVMVKVWVNNILVISRSATSVSQNGTVTLDWVAGDTDEPGPFKVRVVVIYGVQPTTFPANGYMVGNIHPASP